jgi:hypothetical protein
LFLFIKGMPRQRVLKRCEPASSGKDGCVSQARNDYVSGCQQLRFIWRDAIAS